MPGVIVSGSKVVTNEGLAVDLRDPHTPQGLQTPLPLGWSEEDARQATWRTWAPARRNLVITGAVMPRCLFIPQPPISGLTLIVRTQHVRPPGCLISV